MSIFDENAQSEVYSASAGSGKTYTLTKQYILLAMQPSVSYRSIQAITFTNKATAEMKGRILKELFKLKSSPKESPYFQDLKKVLKSEAAIQQRASFVLKNMLDDYSRIRIKTIDSFFQETLRAFARELGQSGSYKVSLDADEIIERAANLLLIELDKKKDPDLYDWLSRITKEQLEEGKGHSIKKRIVELGSELKNEVVLNIIKEKGRLPNLEEIKELEYTANNILDRISNRKQELQKQFNKIIDDNNIDVNLFTYKSNSGIAALKKILNNGNTLECPGKRIIDSATTLKYDGKEVDFPELKGIVSDYINLFETKFEAYNTASAITKYIHIYGILSYIYENVNQICKDENKLLISNTGNLVAKIIDDNEAPFIYEKLGGVIDHHMVDEFQDTSLLQFNNLKPLLQETTAQGKYSMVVGDVKQSIYRWRNADSGILSKLYSAAENGSIYGWKANNLDTNYRSLPNIINFNNAIYDLAWQVMPLDDLEIEDLVTIKEAYRGQRQNIPNKDFEESGLVKIYQRACSKENNGSSEKDYEKPLERLPEVIKDIQLRGIPSSKIAVIVRKGSEARDVANCLLEAEQKRIQKQENGYTFEILSSESLLIDESPAVRFIVDIMRYLSRMNDDKLLALAYQSYIQLDNRSDNEGHFSAEEIKLFNELSRTDLYTLVESLVFFIKDKVQDGEKPYVLAFMDNVSEYLAHEIADLGSFISWWNSKAPNACIEAPEESNGITIMTIHKSKGLEFEAVVAPYLNWDIDINTWKTKILWFDTPKGYSNDIVKIPIRPKKDLQDSAFKKQYTDERIACAMDNLNLLYVLTTRAEKELHLWVKEVIMGKTDEKIKDIGCVLNRCLNKIETTSNNLVYKIVKSGEDFRDSQDPHYKNEGKKHGQEGEDIEIAFGEFGSNHHSSNMLRIKNEASLLFSNDIEEAINKGYALHKVLENISTVDDLDHAIDMVIKEGIIKEEQRKTIRIMLSDALTRPNVARFFDGTYEILNERTIMQGEKQHRPDRVMIDNEKRQIIIIDYKFGEESSKYNRQLNRYRQLFEEMGYLSVEAYLFYVPENKLIKVDNIKSRSI